MAQAATFAQAIVDIGVGVEMCAPRSGSQKGSVEKLVGWVKTSFKPRMHHRDFIKGQRVVRLAFGRGAILLGGLLGFQEAVLAYGSKP